MQNITQHPQNAVPLNKKNAAFSSLHDVPSIKSFSESIVNQASEKRKIYLDKSNKWVNPVSEAAFMLFKKEVKS